MFKLNNNQSRGEIMSNILAKMRTAAIEYSKQFSDDEITATREATLQELLLFNNFMEQASKASEVNMGVTTQKYAIWYLTGWGIKALNGDHVTIRNRQAYAALEKSAHDILSYEYKPVHQASPALIASNPLNTISLVTGQSALSRLSILGGGGLVALGIIMLTVSVSSSGVIPLILGAILTGGALLRVALKKQSNFEKLKTRLSHEIKPQNEKPDSLGQTTLFGKSEKEKAIANSDEYANSEVSLAPLTA